MATTPVTTATNQKTIEQILQQSAKKATSTRNTGEMGKDQFLNLLITQLRNQDPLNPTDDKEFIGQMAQFSSLEQMQNLNKSYTSSKAYSLIGKSVEATYKDPVTSVDKDITGTVDSVKVANGKAYVIVNGIEVDADKVTNVSNVKAEVTVARKSLAEYSGYIGQNVKGAIVGTDPKTTVDINGIATGIEKGDTCDYAILGNAVVDLSNKIGGLNYSTLEDINAALANVKGKETTVEVIDINTGNKASVKATLNDYIVDNLGNIKASLSGVKIPVESIKSMSIS